MEYISSKEIKDLLLEIKEPSEDFNVNILNRKCNNADGRYRRSNSTIKIYLLNHKNKNHLIQTAIHEYAHHIFYGSIGEYVHCTNFWICYFELLKIAEMKCMYDCNIDKSKKLFELTKLINKYNLINSKTLLNENEISILFNIIYSLCEQEGIDFQYYTVKYICMEWFMSKNPMLSYGNIFRKYRIGLMDYNTEKFLIDLYKKYNL